MSRTYLSTDVLPASTFNQIRTFEEQTLTVSCDHLRAIGGIFVKHQVHLDWAIGTLHRHSKLQDDFIMVHEVGKDYDSCKAMQLNQQALEPNSLFLNAEHKFQPFEYDINIKRTSLTDEFLRELCQFLLSNGLSTRLAIIATLALNSSLQEVVEYLLPNNGGTICYSSSPERLSEGPGKLITTGWSFYEGLHGDIGVLEIKRCTVQPSGYHKVD